MFTPLTKLLINLVYPNVNAGASLVEYLHKIDEWMAKSRGVLIAYGNGYYLKFVDELVLWLLLVNQEIYFR